ncbi:hypothetical protein DL766_002984 [Monosporascus sp. MC13-8B]|uniref:Uncharacterized protein n=1 Tax=Monosporascus cannonballus TaxID=155416 RepID=A0ABY0HM28_9PEZI|nr:hypothetical protein DL763_005865 [Monosporascus cannonballus]RYO93746.1 hypothetical protein DL762_000951 [Monosporascus cannonballus]RYP34463.1 hypothetical protein DL766_002984 [Monosporascus sp. MC13-8B]
MYGPIAQFVSSACEDLGWFTDYIPFDSQAGSLKVLGVGTVELPVQREPGRTSGPDAHERRRFEEHRESFTRRQQQQAAVGRYTEAEKQRIKEHYGNEFRFLLQHGLRIYKEEDRGEGRDIVKALMQDDGN